MANIKNNRCYSCKKLFCCEDCCNEHIAKKHPKREAECPLCRKERLRVKNFDNPEFLCHVVFHHLPLQCRICGCLFENSDDLQKVGACEPHYTKNENAKNSLFSTDDSSAIKTPSGLTRCSGLSIDGSYNLNPSNFVSPPEYARNTSTPMHFNVTDSKTNFIFKTPKGLSFLSKTPQTDSLLSTHLRRQLKSNKENNSPNEIAPKDSSCLSVDQTNYQSFSISSNTNLSNRTPLRSILSNRSTMTSDGLGCVSKNSTNSEKKMLDAMEQLDENVRIKSIATTNESTPETGTGSRLAQLKESSKRVRFSDQFEAKEDVHPATSTCDIDTTDNEVFYEARQSLSETTIAIADKLSLSAALVDNENEKNVQREMEEIRDTNLRENQATKASDLPQSKSCNETASSSSARVVMMLVVEKNGALNAEDLAPLIDSSLKKLVAATNGNPQQSVQSSDDDSKSATSVVTVNSYTSVSTVECYKTPETTMDLSRSQCMTPIAQISPPPGGIFSALGQAVKVAFRSLSDSLSSRNIPRKPIGRHQGGLSLLSVIPEAGTTSTKVLTDLASTLVPRTGKRSRDSDDTTPPRSAENSDTANDARSPVPKRPRGWYKIRAREPIASMRNNPSTGQLASTTQYFQRGSLSVCDKILPLPSRAHQSTQTD